MRLRCDPFVRFCLFFDLFFMRLLSFEHNLCVFNSKIIPTASMRCEYRTALVHRLLTWCLVYNNAVNFQIRRFFVVVFYSPFEHRMDFEFFSVRFSSLEVFFYWISVNVFLSANIKYCLLFLFLSGRFAHCFTFVWCVCTVQESLAVVVVHCAIWLGGIDVYWRHDSRVWTAFVWVILFVSLGHWYLFSLRSLWLSVMISDCTKISICMARTFTLFIDKRSTYPNKRTHASSATCRESVAYKRCDIK